MAIRVSGADWKAFCEAQPKGWWHEESFITIDGKEATDEVNLGDVSDDAVMTISRGVMFLDDQGGDDGRSLEAVLRRWRSNSAVARIVVEVPKGQEIAVREAVVQAGGKCIG